MSLQTRIKKLIDQISVGMHEREEIIPVALLGALTGQNTFLYGPPGTAKSLISRRIAIAFDNPPYFEYLMNRFSTPEEVFGPVSIKALKEDQYTRKTENYLPKAEFAFLDEIWKSSPAILNSLLTLINEGVYKNGQELEKAPLKALIAASNETPEENQGLDALYDRFIIRLMVGPIEVKENFERLISSKPTYAEVRVTNEVVIKNNEWASWLKKVDTVELSKETLTIIHLIRQELSEQFEELGVYVSDRRWQKAAQLLKASAFFNNRKQTNHSDALLLRYCLWTTENNREYVESIVNNAIEESGFSPELSLAELDRKKDALDKEITNEIFHEKDVYDTVNIDGNEFFKAVINFEFGSHWDKRKAKKTLYIEKSKMRSEDEFNPVNVQGQELENFNCSFDKQGSCLINANDVNHTYYDAEAIFTPEILYKKGQKKQNVNNRLINALKAEVNELTQSLRRTLELCEAKQTEYVSSLYSPFVSKQSCNIALNGINQQISDLKLRIKDCDRLKGLCSA
ncbi:AAA family ATPase [Pseudoalteromonas agarivorans]|uniref:MoxR-like ATPase n=1 Tax=Pseudoalteromonas agarivorans DSM 14585 TaxID=1312369 RepID=A0ACA8DXP5_9GAMM|nr:AAA family ATPase [Pseudoalteromonas agarivorans]ATC82642.1 MoxR-like ATPase [Pseudoalteromonas agarivorans DSM 14585]